MKDLFKILLVAVGISVFITACDTDAEIKDPANLTDPDRSEQYYEQLRAYKQTDHPVAFGWFGNWVGAGASLENSLRGLPDSVDFVSIWGNWHSLNDVRKADLAYVQQKKGTRALICFIVANVGDQLTPEGIDPIEYWGEGEQGIRRYANAICDTIDKYGYDGFDYDYEPHYGSPGNISGRPEAEKVFIEELGKRIGRKSGTQKLLVIDGEPQSINPSWAITSTTSSSRPTPARATPTSTHASAARSATSTACSPRARWPSATSSRRTSRTMPPLVACPTSTATATT